MDSFLKDFVLRWEEWIFDNQWLRYIFFNDDAITDKTILYLKELITDFRIESSSMHLIPVFFNFFWILDFFEYHSSSERLRLALEEAGMQEKLGEFLEKVDLLYEYLYGDVWKDISRADMIEELQSAFSEVSEILFKGILRGFIDYNDPYGDPRAHVDTTRVKTNLEKKYVCCRESYGNNARFWFEIGEFELNHRLRPGVRAAEEIRDLTNVGLNKEL